VVVAEQSTARDIGCEQVAMRASNVGFRGVAQKVHD
jgi:hypothetical protein